MSLAKSTIQGDSCYLKKVEEISGAATSDYINGEGNGEAHTYVL